MKISNITDLLEEFAPLSTQLEWDNSGRQVGDFDQQATAALLTFDVTLQSIETALARGANLIISHHPLLFSGLKSITGATVTEQIVMRALQNNIAIYACHTNIDCALRGVSWAMAQRLNLQNAEPLCDNGLGYIGTLTAPMSLDEFAGFVKKQYSIPFVKVNTNAPQQISRVAVMGGSGSDEIKIAIEACADAMVTGDAKYHDFQRVSNLMALVDVGHYESEIDIVEIFLDIIQKKYATFVLHTEKLSFVEIK